MAGFSDGTFRPMHSLTRADAVQSLVLASGWDLASEQPGVFLDVPKGHYAAPYIETARRHGMIAPDDEQLFRPSDPATRADLAVMLHNMLLEFDKALEEQPLDDQGHE